MLSLPGLARPCPWRSQGGVDRAEAAATQSPGPASAAQHWASPWYVVAAPAEARSPTRGPTRGPGAVAVPTTRVGHARAAAGLAGLAALHVDDSSAHWQAAADGAMTV